MKRLTLIVTLTIFAVSTFNIKAMAKNKKNEKTLTFIVSMDCHSCVQNIENNIPFEKGVKDLKVSLDKKECEVTFKENKTSAIKLVEAFNELGYTAKIKDESQDEKQENKETDHSSHEGHHHEMDE
ncbi:MAG: heavy-metal-associated domain-containing protein [Prolixibacteraceae bacterium]|nr:heavy-metal-associated domain-containing protein [Prolixibacteraceae bacterium]MBN2650025.1 heavy-metal-associated domain-containing protein [Prolixibacteraceae bacterium]